MSQRMITCCPACSTLFKVEPDQLRIAGGWVRCGQCRAVFDARTRMLPADPYVPPDLDWQEPALAPDNAPPPGAAQGAAYTQTQLAAEDLPQFPAAHIEAAAPAPPAAEITAFAPPAFELTPPSVPQQPAPAPVFIAQPPEPAAVRPTPAPDPAHSQASPPASPLPIPLRDDELDRRYAKLLETLARLRENAENHANDSEGAESMLQSDAGTGLSAPDDRQHRPRRDPARAARRRAAPPDREPASDRQRERGPRPHHRQHAPRDARASRPPELGAEPSASPVLDFALSEIGGLLPLPAAEPFWPEPEPEVKPAQPEPPSFVEQARQRAFWSLPQVRAALGITAGALALALAAQIAVSQRDWLAAHYPGATPLLHALCRQAQCQIGPWRHLGAVVMDSAPVCVRTGPHGLGFAFTLRNGGAAPIATPALELALIDALDQPLARRILQPADWGAPPQLAAYAEFNGAALLTVQDPARPQAVSKCKVEPFYP